MDKIIKNKLLNYTGILTPETLDYLNDLINLKESVLKNKKMNDILGDLEIFREIGMYNIVNRSIELVLGINEIEQSKLIIETDRSEALRIKYKNEDIETTIVKTNFHTTNSKPSIILFKTDSKEIIDYEKTQMQNIEDNFNKGKEIWIAGKERKIIAYEKNGITIDTHSAIITNRLLTDFDSKENDKSHKWINIRTKSNPEYVKMIQIPRYPSY